MTEHPITPPPELVQEWIKKYGNSEDPCWQSYEQDIATQAARWGADQELEACCEWADFHCSKDLALDLRDARRPEPSSKKQRALKALSQIEDQFLSAELAAEIRCALEELPDA